jgi:hypothetical protein
LEVLYLKSGQQDIFFRKWPTAHQSFCVFQLAPLTPRTDGTEPGLLPTPTAVQINSVSIDPESLVVTEYLKKAGKQRQGSLRDTLIRIASGKGLIETQGLANGQPAATPKKYSASDPVHQQLLIKVVSLLPTPGTEDDPKATESLPGSIKFLLGMRGPLNPRFVAEMMGFPVNWTELPFQNGAKLV